jgi:hypothetical protein
MKDELSIFELSASITNNYKLIEQWVKELVNSREDILLIPMNIRVKVPMKIRFTSFLKLKERDFTI